MSNNEDKSKSKLRKIFGGGNDLILAMFLFLLIESVIIASIIKINKTNYTATDYNIVFDNRGYEDMHVDQYSVTRNNTFVCNKDGNTLYLNVYTSEDNDSLSVYGFSYTDDGTINEELCFEKKFEKQGDNHYVSDKTNDIYVMDDGSIVLSQSWYKEEPTYKFYGRFFKHSVNPLVPYVSAMELINEFAVSDNIGKEYSFSAVAGDDYSDGLLEVHPKGYSGYSVYITVDDQLRSILEEGTEFVVTGVLLEKYKTCPIVDTKEIIFNNSI